MNSRGQRVGLHVSAAGGAENAPDKAKEIGAECFQFFSRSPQGGAAPVITDERADVFRQKCTNYGFESYIHTPYYINFASKKKFIQNATPRIVHEELERGSKLGVKYVITHLGSARDYDNATTEVTPKAALDATVAGLKRIYSKGDEFSTRLLLEIAAGAGSVIGDTFEELAYILDKLNRDDVHICLDTCHLFASGYDLRTTAAVETTMAAFRKQIGISQLKLVHANDSKAGLNEHKDRHEHIGHGHIGESGFKAILKHPDLQQVNFILETKHDKLITKDLAFLKKHRSTK